MNYSERANKFVAKMEERSDNNRVKMVEALIREIAEEQSNYKGAWEEKVFNGDLLIDDTFDTIRARVRSRDWEGA